MEFSSSARWSSAKCVVVVNQALVDQHRKERGHVAVAASLTWLCGYGFGFPVSACASVSDTPKSGGRGKLAALTPVVLEYSDGCVVLAAQPVSESEPDHDGRESFVHR
jgi:hypothetical protein